MKVSDDDIARLRGAYQAFSRGDFDKALNTPIPISSSPPRTTSPRTEGSKPSELDGPDAFDRQVIEPVGFTVSGDRVSLNSTCVRAAQGAGSSWRRGLECVDRRRGRTQPIRVEGSADQVLAREAAGLDEIGALSDEERLSRFAWKADRQARTLKRLWLSLPDPRAKVRARS